MKKAIIIGATSGIGEALAKILAREKYVIGLTGRREEKLISLKKSLDTRIYLAKMDISQTEEAMSILKELITQMSGIDCLIINSGITYRSPSWEQEAEVIAVNSRGFAGMARIGFEYFMQKGLGHIVGVSSISGIRGRGEAIVYSATKAFVSNYLQGLRQQAYRKKKAINITDVIPGYVETPIIRGGKNQFWIAPVDKAARQIFKAIKARKEKVYITKRWCLIAWFLKLIPTWLHKRL